MKGHGWKFNLSEQRITEIANASAFQCHKTAVYDDDEGKGRPGDKPQQCVGLMGMLIKAGRPNQIMSLAILTKHLVINDLDLDKCYDSLEQAVRAHAGQEDAKDDIGDMHALRREWLRRQGMAGL
jgi:hypothetical protein